MYVSLRLLSSHYCSSFLYSNHYTILNIPFGSCEEARFCGWFACCMCHELPYSCTCSAFPRTSVFRSSVTDEFVTDILVPDIPGENSPAVARQEKMMFVWWFMCPPYLRLITPAGANYYIARALVWSRWSENRRTGKPPTIFKSVCFTIHFPSRRPTTTWKKIVLALWVLRLQIFFLPFQSGGMRLN